MNAQRPIKSTKTKTMLRRESLHRQYNERFKFNRFVHFIPLNTIDKNLFCCFTTLHLSFNEPIKWYCCKILTAEEISQLMGGN